MAGKARVHELAKELGVTSKQLLETLNEQGEFVKSASSTVEAPVARRIRKQFAEKAVQANATPQPASKKTTASAKKPAAKPAAAVKAATDRETLDAAPAKVSAKPAAPKKPASKPASPTTSTAADESSTAAAKPSHAAVAKTQQRR